MSDKTPEKDRAFISDMVSDLPKELVASIEHNNVDCFSAERIKKIALEKREVCLSEEREFSVKKSLKKTISKVILIAAVVSALSLTVFAAGGMDFIKSLFSGGTEVIEGAIVTSIVSQEAEGKTLSVESMVTDGYVTNMVVSLQGADKLDENLELFDISGDVEFDTTGWNEMYEFSNSEKKYFNIELTNSKRFDKANINVSLNPKVSPIVLEVAISNQLGNAVFNFPESAVSGEIKLVELQISPMGFLLIGKEAEVKGGLPSTKIEVVFRDGKTETIEVEFDSSNDGEAVGGGGGAIMSDDPKNEPLVTSFNGVRNPDNEIVITGQFSRIIDPETIEQLVAEGKSYSMK